jgi:hypothetical protein
MSITTSAFRFALTAAALCAAAPTADARPRRVVVLNFEGPTPFAATGRSSVLTALGDQYDVVAAKRWTQARDAASGVSHGPAQWSRAAKQSGVDAVIEGWVEEEGRHKVLNVMVREAASGREFDTISVRLDGKNGMSTAAAQQLQTNLDEVLEWIQSGRNETPPYLPTVEVSKIGPSSAPADDGATRVRVHHKTIEEDGTVTEAPVAGRRRPGGEAEVATDESTRPAKPDRNERASERGNERADKLDIKAADAPAPADDAAHESKPVAVSAADREKHDIEVLFPQGSEERSEILGPRAVHVPQKTPRVMVDVGAFIDSRSLLWDAPADANVTQFPGVSTQGFQVNAAVYPFPSQQIDGILSGVGFTGSVHHSAGSTVDFDNGDTVSGMVINQNGWELGVHYRTPINSLVAIDGGAFYGNQTFEIVDAPQDFEVPDTKYSYLGASGHLDLAITDRATVGFGVRYFTVLDSGDLASTEWFGPVNASGLGLEGSFVVPLPKGLYVRGQLSYQRISLETTGGGKITDDEGVTSGTDSLISGNVNIGIAF